MEARSIEKSFSIHPVTGQKRTIPQIPSQIFDKLADTEKVRGRYTQGLCGKFLVPAGLVATCWALGGVIKAGTSMNGQYALQVAARYRILAQGFTVMAMIVGAIGVNWQEHVNSRKKINQ